MTSWRPALALALVAAIPLLPGTAGSGSGTPAPTDLAATYDRVSNLMTLTWSPPPGWPSAGVTYDIWRDGTLIGTTTSTSFVDMGLPDLPSLPDAGYVYFVAADPPGSAIGHPAIAGAPTMNCEVVNVLTSWAWPYVYVHMHMECLGIPYDKDTTWHA